MKIFKYLLLVSILLFTSCEEVVMPDLETTEPRLVIEAVMEKEIFDNGFGYRSYVRLTLTAPYFANQVPVVENATVSVTDENGQVYEFLYDENGYYYPANPIIIENNLEYTLKIVYENQVYTTVQNLAETVPLLYVEQNNDGGFSNDVIELKAFFEDPLGEENYYLYAGLSQKGNLFDAINDEFFDGNQIFVFFSLDELEAGDEVLFRLMGIDREAYNYYFSLLLQTEAPAGPFETQPATIRGNIVNQDQPENFPFGYFRISEVSVLSYTVE
ncbi:MAG TPA: DUF4249 domain-containing protein [Flavobacteriaceae bacterium]|nr:DUF4249 domain-containing protein [Flavobacteriaceae bacterium]